MTASPEQVLRRLIEGVTERRWDELAALYAEDTVVEHPLGLPSPTRLDGRAAIAAHFAAARELPLRMRAANVVIHPGADPEIVVGEFDYVGEHTGTGAPFRVANVFVLRVRDGLIVRSRDYSDHARFAAAFGRHGADAACHHQCYRDGMLRIQAQLSEEQAGRLRALAQEEGVSVATLLRRGADMVLEAEPGETVADRRRRALHAVGRFSDDPDVARRHDDHLDATLGR